MTRESELFTKHATEAAIRIGLVGVLVYLCMKILMPFLAPVLWAIILAISTQPMHLRLTKALGGRTKLAASLMAGAALLVLIVPAALLSTSVLDAARDVSTSLEEGSLSVPPPPEGVEGWPLVGPRLYAEWNRASSDLMQALEQNAPQLAEFAGKLLSLAGRTLKDVALFAFSIAIAGALLATSSSGHKLTYAIGQRLAGERGRDLVDLAGGTIRSVAQGVVGTACIQAVLAWIGMAALGVPAAAAWALLVLLFAVAQLPPILVLGPVAIYVFKTDTTVPAVLFGIWSIFVSVSDSFLKPMLLGRGVDVPMLVILLGAIGGLMAAGIIGLFVGAVGLALGHKLFLAWIAEEEAAAASS